MSAESRFSRQLCRLCGPGYRIGDPGCRHSTPCSVCGATDHDNEPSPSGKQVHVQVPAESRWAELLGAHEFSGGRVCSCGEGGFLLPSSHRAHVAAIIAAAVAEEQAKAWEEGYEAFAAQFTKPMDQAGQRPKATNPYRTSGGAS